jgi:hypothetical protein
MLKYLIATTWGVALLYFFEELAIKEKSPGEARTYAPILQMIRRDSRYGKESGDGEECITHLLILVMTVNEPELDRTTDPRPRAITKICTI